MRKCSFTGQTAVSAVAGLLFGPDSRRKTIYLFPANGIRYTISDTPNPTLDLGPTVPATVSAIKLCADDNGDFIRKPIYVIASGNGNVGWIACTEVDDSDTQDIRLGHMSR